MTREFLEDAIRDRTGLLCLLTDRVDGDLLGGAPHLQVVSNYAVGYDNIDVPACSRAKVAVTNTPGVLTEATADLAVALMLAASRRLVEADAFLRDGRWTTWKPDLLVGRGLAGATLGLVGMGQIGQAVARRAKGFDIKILYTDVQPHPGVDASFTSLHKLLIESDFVSIHVPLNDATRGLLGQRELALMKEGSVLVNTARGGVVDEEALVRALTRGPLAAAGLDVFEDEPVSVDHPLLGLPNAVLTPHIGSATIRARIDMGLLAVENLLAALDGRRPPHLVNPEVWGDPS